MDRSYAERGAIAGLARAPRRAPRRRLPGARAAGPVRRALGLLGGFARALLDFLGAHRRLRLALVGALIVAPLLIAGWRWLRDSSLVAVRSVQISGVHGAEARPIEAALRGAALKMTTLDVRPAALRAAVAQFRVVSQLQTSASFPHGLRIHVTEQPPVAVLAVGSERTALAANGVVLGPALASGSLPLLSASRQPPAGRRVATPALLESLTVLGAAPGALGSRVARVYGGPRGLTLQMRGGLLVYFGDASRPHAKWLSLESVLADPSSAGAQYVDVRLPEHPAASFATGTAPAGTFPAGASGSGEQAGGPESTLAAVSAGLAAEAESSGAGASAAGSSQSAAPAQGGSEAGTASGGEAGAASGGEAGPTSAGEASSPGTQAAPPPGG